jgi:hypothetical protein
LEKRNKGIGPKVFLTIISYKKSSDRFAPETKFFARTVDERVENIVLFIISLFPRISLSLTFPQFLLFTENHV